MPLPTLRRYTAAAGFIILMISMHLGNWAGYAWCLANAGSGTAELRDCGCDRFLAAAPGLPGSDVAMGNASFKSLTIEGMPETPVSMPQCVRNTTQRGLHSPSILYSDPFADPLFHPPGGRG
jgi:hypothetical protein